MFLTIIKKKQVEWTETDIVTEEHESGTQEE